MQAHHSQLMFFLTSQQEIQEKWKNDMEEGFCHIHKHCVNTHSDTEQCVTAPSDANSDTGAPSCHVPPFVSHGNLQPTVGATTSRQVGNTSIATKGSGMKENRTS